MRFFITQLVQKFVREEKGQGVVEYGLVLGLVSIVAIAALGLIGTDIGLVFAAVTGPTGLGAVPGV